MDVLYIIHWHELNLRRRVERGLPYIGESCLVSWKEDGVSRLDFGIYETRFGVGYFFIGRKRLRAKTGMLWCRASEISAEDLKEPLPSRTWTDDFMDLMSTAGITSKQLAAQLNYTASYVSRVLNGRYCPPDAEGRFKKALSELLEMQEH